MSAPSPLRAAARARRWTRTHLVLVTVVVAGVVTAGLLWGLGVITPVAGPGQTVGFVTAPGGPFLYDPSGRVVILHGVNAVYKRAPFELYADPGQPWNFTATDASAIAQLGFDVVRLGILWQGLEPGEAPANDPAICGHGSPRNPDQFDRQVFDAYIARVEDTVDLLARYHVYTILDMHQDLYSQLFGGDGAPDWAVCTNGPVPAQSTGYRPYDAALENFWTNDVVGDLQGEYDRMWGMVAHVFRQDPWVLGYDPFNEPSAPSAPRSTVDAQQASAEIECFYTGRLHPGLSANGKTPVACPPDDPEEGLVPTILRADPHHLLFLESSPLARPGRVASIGPINAPNLVFNFHAYCADRSLVTGAPTNVDVCSSQAVDTVTRAASERTHLSTATQPGGPAWFMSEFGATNNVAVVSAMTDDADRHLLGWTFWSWKRYADPVSGADKSLVTSSGGYQPTVKVLSRTYAQAIAGTPRSMSYDWTTGHFVLTYTAALHGSAPTVVFVATAEQYPHGYCARVSGGTVISPPDADHLVVTNDRHAGSVTVEVTAGECHH